MRLVLDINASGQMVTDDERAYWESEADGIAAAIAGGEVQSARLATNAEDIETQGKGIVGSQISSMVAGGVATIIVTIIATRCSG